VNAWSCDLASPVGSLQPIYIWLEVWGATGTDVKDFGSFVLHAVAGVGIAMVVEVHV